MSDPSIWRVHGTPLLPRVSPGPLDGLGVAVKDVFAVGGFAVGAGNPRWLAQAPAQSEDAWAVAALRRAGAAVNGIAQTDELAFSLSGVNTHYGTPPNPAATALVTAGSSSGPAAAVASGQADIGLGTDTAGSIRVPASVCGLFGMRPTHGAVPADGALHLAPSFDTVGWLAAGPSVLQAAGSVLLGSPEGPRQPRPPRRLMSIDRTNDLVHRLSGTLGAEMCPWHPSIPGPDDITELLTAFRTIQTAEAWQLHGRWITANPGALHPDVEARFRAGADVDASVRRRAAEVIAAYRARTLNALGDDTWLVLPAAAGPGHARDASRAEMDAWRQATLRHTVIASAFGLPSCVVPGDKRPPVGMAVVGPPGADHALLEAVTAVCPPR
ncbi:MAG: amidase [Streptosporangiaceae bacterium]|nr:amidase [Streptosporangiaceae bacterium]